MTISLLSNFVVLLSIFSTIGGVAVVGYLENACNGEELYAFAPAQGHCIDVSSYELAMSLTVSQFVAGEIITFFSDSACSISTNDVGSADSEECFLVPIETSVMSFEAISST